MIAIRLNILSKKKSTEHLASDCYKYKVNASKGFAQKRQKAGLHPNNVGAIRSRSRTSGELVSFCYNLEPMLDFFTS